jgi:hypothetical protein
VAESDFVFQQKVLSLRRLSAHRAVGPNTMRIGTHVVPMSRGGDGRAPISGPHELTCINEFCGSEDLIEPHFCFSRPGSFSSTVRHHCLDGETSLPRYSILATSAFSIGLGMSTRPSQLSQTKVSLTNTGTLERDRSQAAPPSMAMSNDRTEAEKVLVATLMPSNSQKHKPHLTHQK